MGAYVFLCVLIFAPWIDGGHMSSVFVAGGGKTRRASGRHHDARCPRWCCAEI